MNNKKINVFVPCPVEKNEYAGWLFQMKNYAIRNKKWAQFTFIFRNSQKSMFSGVSILNSIALAVNVRREISKQKGSSIVLFPMFFFPNMLVALLLPTKCPYVVRISGNELMAGNQVVFRIRTYLLRRAKSVVTLNQSCYNRLTDLGIEDLRRELIPNSVSSEYRPPISFERVEARKQLGLAPGQFVVGSVGTICPRKQQLQIIKAAGCLSGIEKVVVLAGPWDGHNEADPSYAKQCRELAKGIDLRLIMTGRSEDMLPIYWAFDVFVLASTREGMPNSLLEAMACGLPCIVSDVPGCRDIVDGLNTPILMPVGDTAVLGKQLNRVAASLEFREKVARESISLVERSFAARMQDRSYSSVLGFSESNGN